ncbi:MAG: site-2 protease family protein [Oligoflexia bacterium]|jgi:Zn-dependent protease/CBS domain-containing protein
MTGQSWTIARFRGVRIRLHFTLLLMIPYLAYIIAVRFKALVAQAGISADQLAFSDLKRGPLIWGALFAASLFASVLVHELAHVWVAQRQGSKVRSILLMMLGGVSDIDADEVSPKKEARLSLIGPAMSFFVAGLGWLLWRVQDNASLSFAGHWLFQSNLVLAIFNLLPAFPLDGGRALRASLAARIGRVRATRVAVRLSHGFAWFLGALGVLSFNLFLVLIAFFLYASAQAEWSLLMSRGLLEGLRAGDVTTLVPPVQDAQSLSAAIAQMLHSRVTALPVAHEGGSLSIVTLQQLRSVPFHFRETTLVRDLVAGHRSAVLAWDTPLSAALSDLAAAQHGALPVTAQGKVIGILKYSDLTEVLQLRSLEKPAA